MGELRIKLEFSEAENVIRSVADEPGVLCAGVDGRVPFYYSDPNFEPTGMPGANEAHGEVKSERLTAEELVAEADMEMCHHVWQFTREVATHLYNKALDLGKPELVRELADWLVEARDACGRRVLELTGEAPPGV